MADQDARPRSLAHRLAKDGEGWHITAVFGKRSQGCYHSEVTPATARNMMPIDPAIEQTFPLKAPRSFGCNRSPRTVYRWVTEGHVNLFTGQAIVLETIRVGAYMETSREAYYRFLKAINERSPSNGQEQEDDEAEFEDQAGEGEGDAA